MRRSRNLAALCAALACGCAAAAPAPSPLTSLPTAQPRVLSAQGTLHTGQSQRVAMVLRREQAFEHARRYIDALNTRDMTTIESLFADGVITGDSGVVVPRAQLVGQLGQLLMFLSFSRRNSGGAAAALALSERRNPPDLRTSGAWLQGGDARSFQSFELRPTDWILTAPSMGYEPHTFGSSLSMPHLLVIRFVDGEPLFVASLAYASRR